MFNAFFRKISTRRFRRPLWIAAIVFVLIGCISTGLFFILKNSDAKGVISHREIAKLWNEGNIEKTIAESRKATEAFPFDEYYLSMRGISAYYSALDAQDEETRQQLLEESVISLRKALVIGVPSGMEAQIFYVLAKAYYQKGEPWFDLAERYFLLARNSGSKEKDLPQYLAVVYAGKKDYKHAIEWFELSLKGDTSDILTLSAAISYKNIGKNDKARELLASLETHATDAKIRLKAKLLLAQDSYESGDFSTALQRYEEILKEDPLNADAWYGLGLVYAKKNDQLGARAAFRKVVQIDPNHVDARKRLAEKL